MINHPFGLLRLRAALTVAVLLYQAAVVSAQEPGPWIPLFDGQSLEGWRAVENSEYWKVEEGCIVANGPRSHLFYEGPVGSHDFKNFELEVEAQAERNANSGIFFHTRFQESNSPSNGYEVQINSSFDGRNGRVEKKRTGSLYGVRNTAKAFVPDGEWFRLKLKVVGNRVRIWVNGFPTVDYLEPITLEGRPKKRNRKLSRGTIALQEHHPDSRVRFRSIQIRLLPDDADPMAEPRGSDAGYGVTPERMDRLNGASIPFIDLHVHLRGGMTPEKALERQAVTGINCGVIENVGRGWPLETNEQLGTFLDQAEGGPLFLGVQVNDRDWMDTMDPKLRARLDYVLADTMIMRMPDDDGPPVKLWMPELYTIDDPEAWMERYMRHNLCILNEPISILANPTWLPPALADRYDEFWSEDRMRQIIQAAIDNNVALEINANGTEPLDRFIALAREMGAKFSFGSNNFDNLPIDMTRCFDAIDRHRLTQEQLFVPTSSVGGAAEVGR